jgi:hypothetical protein
VRLERVRHGGTVIEVAPWYAVFVQAGGGPALASLASINPRSAGHGGWLAGRSAERPPTSW